LYHKQSVGRVGGAFRRIETKSIVQTKDFLKCMVSIRPAPCFGLLDHRSPVEI
jgi:hypothetical protein